MKRWTGLAYILALLTIVTMAPAVRAGVTDLYIKIDNYERNPAQLSTFDVAFTVHVPADVTIPSSTPAKSCLLYYSTFFFVGKDIYYPAERYWWGDYSGSVFYDNTVTDYTVKVKMGTGEKVDETWAPVGQEFYLGIYWKIPLESNWSNPEGKDINLLAKDDNITFRIYGDENTYKMPIVKKPDVYSDYTRYTLFDGPVSDIFVKARKDEGYLFVRTLKGGLTVTAAPGPEIPLEIVIAGVVVLMVVIAIIALARRRGREELPPAPEMPPPPPPEAPPPPPEAPPAPPGP